LGLNPFKSRFVCPSVENINNKLRKEKELWKHLE
jgi:hypothetical protein